ncbi:MAG: AAA family ATPase [Bacilli bacterium]|nr:AAA family ATPase [Bacilli bacterium]
MIGQKELIMRLNDLINIGKFPSFCILVGPRGSGKKLMADNIVSWLKSSDMYPNHIVKYTLPDLRVDTVRQMIEDAYTIKEFTVMIIEDADTMSLNAKNALLKITEEPPENVIFIMTLRDLSNTLPTIKSRANYFQMDIYTIDEILEYAKLSNEDSRILSVCETPGEVDLMKKCGIKELSEYVNLVIDNIAEVQPANAFKSSSKLALKTDEGIDLGLFWKVFIDQCAYRMIYGGDKKKYAQGVLCTADFVKCLNSNNVNKSQLYDSWVFDIRKVWG